MRFFRKLFRSKHSVVTEHGGQVISIKEGSSRIRVKLVRPDGSVDQYFVLKRSVEVGSEVKPDSVIGTF